MSAHVLLKLLNKSRKREDNACKKNEQGKTLICFEPDQTASSYSDLGLQGFLIGGSNL